MTQRPSQYSYKRNDMMVYIEARNGNNGTISDIYRAQGEVEAGALNMLVKTASAFIKNSDVRSGFLGNAEAFTIAQLDCINGNCSMEEKNLSLSYLRQEQEYLQKQISWLDSKQVKPAASVEINFINNVLSYIVKGIGLVGGVLQVIGGGILLFASAPTVVGSVAGGVLVLHGITNILENGASLFYGNDNYVGPATQLYGDIANSLGYDRSYGKLAFAGIDLTVSAYALFGTKLIPDAWRLVRYIPKDYEMGFRLMSGWELLGELVPDSATSYSGIQTYFSLPVDQPDPPSNPLLPFPDN